LASAGDGQSGADLYRKEAELGGAEAQYNLGVMYAQGRGVEVDLVQALKWFNLAAVAGDGNSRQDISQLERKMSGEQIAQARKLAQEWLAQHK